jgi:hypothetical protein
MVLGAWGALVPFIGHYFGYGFTPDNTWGWTAARGWLEVLPGAVTFLGGAVLTASASRPSAVLAGWLAALSGAWFALSSVLTPWWSAGSIGTADGGTNKAVLEHLGMFTGLGVLIVFLAAIALGRVTVVGVRDQRAAQARLDAQQQADEQEHTTLYPEELPTSAAGQSALVNAVGNDPYTAQPIRDFHTL